jgi:formylglycine-generating enzyme required for sulfatase activity
MLARAGSFLTSVLVVAALLSAVPAGAPNDKTVTNSVGMKFARIPAGSFVMGSPDGEKGRGRDEKPHDVVITRPFYLGIHEVTQGQYQKVTGKSPSFFAATGVGKGRVGKLDTTNHPVETVSWFDAVAFCKKLGELPAERAARRRYRLPTEAEWEYACRAGTTTATHFGASMDTYQANFNGLSAYNTTAGGPFFRRTVRVAEYKPNAWGLYDMHANAQEWVADWYGDYAVAGPKDNPRGPKEGTDRVLRGGGWPHSGKACRSAVRNKLAPDQAHYSAGFRVVMIAE